MHWFDRLHFPDLGLLRLTGPGTLARGRKEVQ
jgi:hypothetical protein